jgi:hypothetical protein
MPSYNVHGRLVHCDLEFWGLLAFVFIINGHRKKIAVIYAHHRFAHYL